jgi:hypothetical protein
VKTVSNPGLALPYISPLSVRKGERASVSSCLPSSSLTSLPSVSASQTSSSSLFNPNKRERERKTILLLNGRHVLLI